MSTPAAPSPTPRPRPRVGPWPFALIAVVAGLVAAYLPNFVSLVQTWWTDPDYSHGFLVPIVALVIFFRREQVPRPLLRPSAMGWALLVAALAARSFFRGRGQNWSETATLMPAIFGLVLAAGGWPLLRRSWPAFAYLVFMLPLPIQVINRLSLPLQSLATSFSTKLLRLTGLWVIAEGNVITVGKEHLEVATACNGLSMLMCLSATVAATVAVVPMASWKRIILMLSIVPIALGCNVLRIAATAWSYYLFGPEIGSRYAHDAAGWLMMPTALVLVGLELGWLSWMIVETPAEADGPTMPFRAGMA